MKNETTKAVALTNKEIKFRGIDGWGRPVFKAVVGNCFYGSTNRLFDDEATEEEVLEKVSEFDLCFFGNHFNCEPMGSSSLGVVIV